MKLKIFSEYQTETNFNDWMAENPNVEIKFTNCSEALSKSQCAMQMGEDFVLDADYMERKWQEYQHDFAVDSLTKMEEEQKVVENSGVPKHFHSKF